MTEISQIFFVSLAEIHQYLAALRVAKAQGYISVKSSWR